MKTKTRFGYDFRVDMRVMVFPLPGGPQMMKGFFWESHWPRNFWWR